MTVKQLRLAVRARKSLLLWGLPLLALIGWLLTHHLATLTPGLSRTELQTAHSAVGWHGIYNQPLDLPLKLMRSVIFFLFPDHGQLLTRLPNAFFGGLAIVTFGAVISLWHGRRTAILSTLLFSCSAWVLHVSRLASFDVLYLWAMPSLLLTHVLLHKYSHKTLVWYGSLAIWVLLLYIPGMIWLLLFGIIAQRRALLNGWQQLRSVWYKLLAVLGVLIWLPLLAIDLTRSGQLTQWLGFPAQFPAIDEAVKQLAAVPVHLLIRGPQYPELWLAQAPLFDVFSLVAAMLGIYFYARHWRAARSRLLAGYCLLGTILVGLGGPVSLSLLVPLLYCGIAAGLAYLAREWLQVFPLNPLARGLGIGLLVFAVGLSCIYNTRAYFVAWPNTALTKATFHYHP